MNQTTNSTARDVFLYLLVTVTLYTISVSAISTLFQYVNHFFPDPVNSFNNVSDVLRVSLSVLIIFTPVYVWVAWFLNKDMLAHAGKYSLAIRRWLIHLTLFVSGITIMIDLATLIYNFLGGELSMRFALKTLSVLIVAAAVFAYYIWDIRREAKAMPVKMMWLARVTLVLLAASVIGGFFIMESPAQQRLEKLDNQRVTDLWTVQGAVENYWYEQTALPESLTGVNVYLTLPVDPQTGEGYEYNRLTDTTYELCATFTYAPTADMGYSRPIPYGSGLAERDFYAHKVGHDCFTRDVSRLK
ncbi:hypothetical protein COV06_01945 [Candidatus Uhrbacteria bacterium CG10_big_fil_rev_8_21_14_0_10_50_16]|uniref:DUF5671 domain-containing protein n=1 Tax=Candidatus Uhrbacteria bacterium CG10_big_fil_rev_8_21_14_0_10_50_16 TaxID=1975039 RepID=A0A2H0RP11_9BACT|nr:MAG: hypothetical protein COV06_01945 [Candidatus Uhrbacteria bacterium CG10_big_fil_rev_8_21_14_0_10_50_16]